MTETDMTQSKNSKLVLPLTIMSHSDINRLYRELEALEEFLVRAKATSKEHELPLLSHNLDGLAKQNNLDLLKTQERSELQKHLLRIKEKSPHIHISFATDPSAAFMAKIVGWFRSQVHPEVLIQTGLAPNIAAGCIIRTLNHSIDLSLRRNLSADRQILIDRIKNPAKKVEIKEATESGGIVQ